MQTQPEVAVGSETTAPEDPFEAIAEETFGADEAEQPPEGDEEVTAEDEPEIEEEDDELPPIDPPVSYDAEAKERFAKLPREDQEYWSKREGERERFVQSKSQEAALAKRDVEQAAVAELAQIEQGYARHFQQLADQLQPQRPDPAMLQYDPAAFYAQQARYEETAAQQHELQQRSSQFAQQAQAREAQAEQAYHAEQHRIIVEQFPEYTDPTTGSKIQQELTTVARELGYPPELISQARATDILAMRKVAELKAKADKFDAITAKRMEKVRAAKGLPKVATPGVSQGSDQLRANRATAAWETVKSAKSRSVRDEAAAEWLTNAGYL